MGKSKPFIDKKNATRYSLTYNTTSEEPADGASSSASALADASLHDLPPYLVEDDVQWMAEMVLSGKYEDRSYKLTEEQRKEILDLGFPDDGYNYLQHLRDAVRPATEVATTDDQAATSSAPKEVPVGPSFYIPAPKFVPPSPDVKLVDARRLVVASTVEDEAEALAKVDAVSAMSRQGQVQRGRLLTEVHELEECMAEVEADDEAGEGEYADWLESFVVEAAQPQEQPAPLAKDLADACAESNDEECDSEYSELESDEVEDQEDNPSESEPKTQAGNPKPAGSIASSYWREERTDRRAFLGAIDDRFETVALEYDDDDMEDLDDDDENARGHADIAQYSSVLEDFCRDSELDSSTITRAQPGRNNKLASLEEVDEEVIAKTHLLLHKKEECDAEPLSTVLVEATHERWDCESVLSLRSNLDNHPGQIVEPLKSRKQATGSSVAGTIKLSAKTGLPVGYVGTATKLDAVAETSPCINQTDNVAEELPVLVLTRDRNETPEEKKARKAAVKDMRKAARVAKKEVKTMFKNESVKQHRQAAGKPQTSTIPLS